MTHERPAQDFHVYLGKALPALAHLSMLEGGYYLPQFCLK
jgi:hypothetical protein